MNANSIIKVKQTRNGAALFADGEQVLSLETEIKAGELFADVEDTKHATAVPVSLNASYENARAAIARALGQ